MYSEESEQYMIDASNHSDYIAQALSAISFNRELYQIYHCIVNGFTRAMRLDRNLRIDYSEIARMESLHFQIMHHFIPYYLRTLEWHNHLTHQDLINIDIRDRNSDINTWLGRRRAFDEFVARNNRMPDSYPNGFSYPESIINYFNGRLSNV